MTEELKSKLGELARQDGEDGLLPKILLELLNSNDKANAGIISLKEALAAINKDIVAKQAKDISALKGSIDNNHRGLDAHLKQVQDENRLLLDSIVAKQAKEVSALKESIDNNHRGLDAHLKQVQDENRLLPDSIVAKQAKDISALKESIDNNHRGLGAQLNRVRNENRFLTATLALLGIVAIVCLFVFPI